MHHSPSDARAHARSCIEALRKGDVRQARESFERVVAAGQADASAYLGLAYACTGLKDHPAAVAAVDRALALEPRNLGALIMKADYLAALGDARAARRPAAGRPAQRAREGGGHVRALRRAIRSLSPGAAGRPGAGRAGFQRTLQGFARPSDGQEEDLLPGAPPILLPGAPPDPVL